jgi:hypothetical protein
VSVIPYPELPTLEAPPASGWIANLQVGAEIAKSIADTDFVPTAIRHNVPAVTATIMYGLEIGLGPMAALRGIVMIEGRPTLYAETQRALILAAGHDLWIEESTIARAMVSGRRRGAEKVTRLAWTMEDARRARLDQKNVWRAYPREMLLARASAALARAVFPDVIGGLGAAEELDTLEAPSGREAEDAAPAKGATRSRPDAAGPVLASTSHQALQAPRRRREEPAVRGDQPEPGALGGPLRADQPSVPEPLTQAQLRKIQAAFRRLGVERADRLAASSRIIGRPITSSNELTTDEAQRIIDTLASQDAAAGSPPTPGGPPEALAAAQTGQGGEAAPGGPAGEDAPPEPAGDAALAASFQAHLDHENTQQTQLDQDLRVQAMSHALFALSPADRNDLKGLIVDAQLARRFEDVTAVFLAEAFADLEPTPQALLALRNQLAEAQR